jgi:hypothetical protein
MVNEINDLPFEVDSDALAHLDVYIDYSVLFEDGTVERFLEGPQGDAAKNRYDLIDTALMNGYLDDLLDGVRGNGFQAELSQQNRDILSHLADGMRGTSCSTG